MIFSEKLPLLVQVSLSKLLFLPKHRFHIHLKPPRSNQSLKKFLDSNHPAKVLLLFRYLFRERASSIDSFSFLFVLKACTQKKHFTILGEQVHGLIIKLGFETIVQLQTCLLKMYSEWGKLHDVHKLFEEIPSKNSLCWTSMISAYVENQRPRKALQLFRQMQVNNVEPDQVTVTIALSACADIGSLGIGE